MATQWGILGSGNIASDFVTALKLLPATEHQVVAVAARSADRAKAFAQRFEIPKSYGSYEELSKASDVEIVYVANIQTVHCEASKLMLNAGKHVLCEKPLGMNSREVKEMIQLAQEKKRFFMEGFWTRCFPVYDKLRQVLASGVLGEPRLVQASFGVRLIDKPTVASVEAGGGALMALGCYNILLADMVFGGRPESIRATGDLHESGVDDLSTITLKYRGGGLAVLSSAVSVNFSNRADIECTQGRIELPSCFWSPSELIVNGEKMTFPLPECTAPLNYPNSEGFVYEAKHVRDMLQQGKLESPLVSHESMQTIADIMTETRRQLGVVYPADKVLI